MKKFTETIHCTSETHCTTCRSDAKWRESMMGSFEWDGTCPRDKDFSTQTKSSKASVPRVLKHCRLGNKECANYRECRDTCRVIDKRITSMGECPEL